MKVGKSLMFGVFFGSEEIFVGLVAHPSKYFEDELLWVELGIFCSVLHKGLMTVEAWAFTRKASDHGS